MRLTTKSRQRIITGLKKSWQDGGTHREKQKENAKNDFESERKRILLDSRGKEEFTIIKNNERFSIIRSLKGRTDQFDIEKINKDFTKTFILTCSGPNIFKNLINLE